VSGARVLCALDFSDASDEALRQADARARRDGAELAVFHAIEHVSAMQPLAPALGEQGVVEAEQRARDLLRERVTAVTGRAGTDVQVYVAVGRAHAEVVRAAERLLADLLVIGSHGGSGIARVLLGGVAEKVVRHAHCPVLVARARTHTPGPARTPASPAAPASDAREVVLAATDLSDPSLPAVELGAREAERRGARFVVLHAIDLGELGMTGIHTPSALMASVPAEAIAHLRASVTEQIARALGDLGVTAEIAVVEGPSAAVIVRHAEELGADLVVVGTRGRTGISRVVLGSVAEKVVQNAASSVLAVRLHGT
jgi:nucleotide-binding universal stress UspA family protein